MVPKPLHGGFEAQTLQMHRQINCPAAAVGLLPVHEFCTGDRQRSLLGMPLGFVVSVSFGPGGQQNRLEGHAPNFPGPLPDLLVGHAGGISFGRRLTHFFMLIT